MTQMKLQVGHSPDPDDAFMFYGIQSGNVDTEGFTVEHVIEDIESLNQRALKGELEISAISLHCYAHVADRYAILPCGVSMGDDYGPILVALPGATVESLRGQKIAAPGPLTTAALVAQIIIPGIQLVHMPFDEILPAVTSGKIEAGILIHEGQLTYREAGLVNLLDFGKWWKREKGLPLPLGVDVVRRDLGEWKIAVIYRMLKGSIEYALEPANRPEALKYALKFGRGIAAGLADQFVGMYVNHYTVDFGERGRKAVRKLLEEARRAGLIPAIPRSLFSDEAEASVPEKV